MKYRYLTSAFRRPVFNEMMTHQGKKINCILVKDLCPGLEENIWKIGNYIEKVFPFLGVRFISVNDHFDTEHKSDDKKSF